MPLRAETYPVNSESSNLVHIYQTPFHQNVTIHFSTLCYLRYGSAGQSYIDRGVFNFPTAPMCVPALYDPAVFVRTRYLLSHRFPIPFLLLLSTPSFIRCSQTGVPHQLVGLLPVNGQEEFYTKEVSTDRSDCP